MSNLTRVQHYAIHDAYIRESEGVQEAKRGRKEIFPKEKRQTIYRVERGP